MVTMVTFVLLQVMMDSPGPDLLDSSGRKKTQRCKRTARLEKDRAPPKNKRRKREEEEKTLHSSTSSSSDPLVTHLSQVDQQHLPGPPPFFFLTFPPLFLPSLSPWYLVCLLQNWRVCFLHKRTATLLPSVL